MKGVRITLGLRTLAAALAYLPLIQVRAISLRAIARSLGRSVETPVTDRDRSSITLLLRASRGGDKTAFDELMTVVYDRLHRLASRRLSSERRGHTLRTTEVVHEAYLRLIDADVDWNDRGHFYAIAAQVMRRILIDHAKSRNSGRRGGAFEKVSIDTAFELGSPSPSNLIEVNEALERLSAVDPRKGTIIELLIFGGLTYEEAAEAVGVSPATLHRELKLAKAWLHRELTAPPPTPAALPHGSG